MVSSSGSRLGLRLGTADSSVVEWAGPRHLKRRQIRARADSRPLDSAENLQLPSSDRFRVPRPATFALKSHWPCRGAPFRAENGGRPPVDVVVAWSSRPF